MNNTNIIIKINDELHLSIIQESGRLNYFQVALLDKEHQFNHDISNKYGYDFQVKDLFDADELTKEIERIKNIYNNKKGK